MFPVSYSVFATLPDAQTAAEYIGWLEAGHLRAVILGGALDGAILVSPDSSTQVVESRYTFANLDAFKAYERDHAPALREEGLGLFGTRDGVRFERRLGIIKFSLGGQQKDSKV